MGNLFIDDEQTHLLVIDDPNETGWIQLSPGRIDGSFFALIGGVERQPLKPWQPPLWHWPSSLAELLA